MTQVTGTIITNFIAKLEQSKQYAHDAITFGLPGANDEERALNAAYFNGRIDTLSDVIRELKDLS